MSPGLHGLTGERLANGARAARPESSASDVELETVIVRLYDRTGDERGFVELPASWALSPGDVHTLGTPV